ncbi:MAG TPA: hypothetical protein VGM08_01100 [Candidatus Saccharimonadales bacterium]|jgi:hypothetical protein
MRRPTLSQLTQLMPGTIELWYVALITGVLLFLGNGNVLLEKLGLIGTSDLIGQQVSTKVTRIFEFLSGLSFSANASSMIVWGGAGLIIYSTLQALLRYLRTLQYEHDIDLTYSHPREYTHRNFVRQLVMDTLLGLALVILLVLCLILYFATLLPNSFAYVQHFLVTPSFSAALDPVYGLAVAFLGTTIVYIILRLVINRHRLAAYTEALEPPLA